MIFDPVTPDAKKLIADLALKIQILWMKGRPPLHLTEDFIQKWMKSNSVVFDFVKDPYEEYGEDR